MAHPNVALFDVRVGKLRAAPSLSRSLRQGGDFHLEVSVTPQAVWGGHSCPPPLKLTLFCRSPAPFQLRVAPSLRVLCAKVGSTSANSGKRPVGPRASVPAPSSEPWSLARFQVYSLARSRHGDLISLSVFGALAALRKRPHEFRRTRHVGGGDPSSGTTLKTEPPIEGAEDCLHFRREHLKRLAGAIASHHTDAYCLF